MNLEKPGKWSAIIFLLFLWSCAGMPSISLGPLVGSKATTPVAVVIDGTKRHQVMEGFGATHLPLVYEGRGDVLGPRLRASAINLVYKQVGITTGNLEGALLESPAGWNERANDDNDPSTIRWAGFQPFNARAIKQRLVDLAEPLGFDNYFLGQKVNVRWASPWLDQIRNRDYNRYLDEVAEQVVAGQLYWRNEFGIVPRYEMLFNEPLSGNRELLNGTVRDVVDIIKRAGGRLRDAGFTDIKFIVPNEETEEISLNTARAILSDPEARQYVGAIGYHTYPYGSVYSSIPRILSTSGAGRPDPGRVAVREALRDLGSIYGIPVWMTEVSHGSVDPRSFDDLLGRAIHIHDELVYADAAAYFGMNNMWDAVSHQLHSGGHDHNLFSEEGTIALIDNRAENIYLTGMGYAIGHYARWIKRGAVRIEATSSDPLLQVSAFRENDRRRMIFVTINNAPSERQLQFTVNGSSLSAHLIGEQSTAAAYWRPLESFEPGTEGSFSLSVPAKSVTTIAAQFDG